MEVPMEMGTDERVALPRSTLAANTRQRIPEKASLVAIHHTRRN